MALPEGEPSLRLKNGYVRDDTIEVINKRPDGKS
jgi:hypothetical protein